MKNTHYNFIDALRGYAILAVMAVHAAQAVPTWGGAVRQLVDQGARGVQLFFVASALTLAMSWHARNDGLLPFYTRRLFRIAPMFWLGIVFFVWLNGFGPSYFAPNGIGAIHVVLTVFFLHGWHPGTINSVVPGGWSIAVEIMFYLIFPALVFFIRGLRAAVIGLVLSTVLALGSLAFFWLYRERVWPEMPDGLMSSFLSFWFPNQLPVFMIGFVVYFAIRDWPDRFSAWALRSALCGAIAAMVALPFTYKSVTIMGHGLGVFGPALYGVCFGIFAFCLAEGVGTWFVNAPIRFLGKVSFSAYLIHFAVIDSGFGTSFFRCLNNKYFWDGSLVFLVYFLAIIAITSALSSITYWAIEQPMIALGNRLIRQNWNRRLPSPGAPNVEN